MAFGNILKVNPITHDGSEAGHVAAKINELFQQDGKDFKVNLSTSGKDYIRYDTTNAAIRFYINDVLQGHVNAAGMAAD